MSEEIRDGPVSKGGPEKPKIGAGALAAMGRQGLNELRAAVMPDSNIAQPTETGAIGTATPGEIADARENEPQTEGLVGAAVGAGAVAGLSLVDRIKEMYGREKAATPEKSPKPQKSRERGMEKRVAMLTFLIVIAAVFVVLRWSVKQPMQAHTAYTSLENLFRKRSDR